MEEVEKDVNNSDLGVSSSSTERTAIPPPPPPPPPPAGVASSPAPPTPASPEGSTAPSTEENKKRFYVMQEIISTEVTYVERLRLTLDHVVKPLRENNVLNQAEINSQFDILKSICELHERHSLAGSTSNNLKFVELFEDMAKNIEIYPNYLMNYEPAMQQRAKLLTSNRRFADFVDKVQKDPVLQNQNMESLLILPVQRIPRYRLLLEQLLKYTEESHPDYPTVKQALDKICELAHYNNEAIRVRENKTKMMSIMMQIEPTTRKDFLEKGERMFLREGPLMKQCRKRYKGFQFWLFSDILCYGEMTPIALYRFNREINLASSKITALEESDPDYALGFIVASPAKSFKLKANDVHAKKEWENAIQEAMVKAKEKSGEVDEAIAPIWKPDEKATNCEKCKASFNILFRRHHCRNCGSVVCTNCSKKRFFLPHVDKKTVRVCDPCFDYLFEQQKAGGKIDASTGSGKTPTTESKKLEESNDNLGNNEETDDDDDDDEERRSVTEEELHEFQQELSQMEIKTRSTSSPVPSNAASGFTTFFNPIAGLMKSPTSTGTPNNQNASPPDAANGPRFPRRTNIFKDPELVKQISKTSTDGTSDDNHS